MQVCCFYQQMFFKIKSFVIIFGGKVNFVALELVFRDIFSSVGWVRKGPICRHKIMTCSKRCVSRAHALWNTKKNPNAVGNVNWIVETRWNVTFFVCAPTKGCWILVCIICKMWKGTARLFAFMPFVFDSVVSLSVCQGQRLRILFGLSIADKVLWNYYFKNCTVCDVSNIVGLLFKLVVGDEHQVFLFFGFL